MSYFERLANLMSKEMRHAYSMSNIEIPPKAMLFHTNPIHLPEDGKAIELPVFEICAVQSSG